MKPEDNPLNKEAGELLARVGADSVLIIAAIRDADGMPMLLANSAGPGVCLRFIARQLDTIQEMVERMADRCESRENGLEVDDEPIVEIIDNRQHGMG